MDRYRTGMCLLTIGSFLAMIGASGQLWNRVEKKRQDEVTPKEDTEPYCKSTCRYVSSVIVWIMVIIGGGFYYHVIYEATENVGMENEP